MSRRSSSTRFVRFMCLAYHYVMDLASMILHVLQFADQPLTVQEIARRIGAEFNESATSEQVTDSIESSLLPAGRLVFEQGLSSLPEDALPATTEDLAVALTPGPGDKATWQRVLAEGGYDDCGRSLIFDRLVPLLWRLVYWRHLLLAASVGRELT